MQLKVSSGKVDLSGETVLEDVNIEINTNSKIALVGRNGCGKTTFLKLIAGRLPLSNSESDGGFIARSGNFSVSMLDQITFPDQNALMIDEIRSVYKDILSMQNRINELVSLMKESENTELIEEYTALLERFTNEGGFYFEKEYEAAIKRFGFTNEDKIKPVGEFSGGQRTKIAFLKLLLSKPDLLLLDEPTNHLDTEAVLWLEDYLADYKKAFVIVSHDRMFLDKTVNEVYEIENGKTYRYFGNYTEFTKLKKISKENANKMYENQQKEIERITATAERFRYKATKASMAQSKLKQIEKMEKIEAPITDDIKTFRSNLKVDVVSAKDVLQVNNLAIGYDSTLCNISFEIKRGDRLGIIGGNGLGKSTLLKTFMGHIPAISGDFHFGGAVRLGYFDQQLAAISSTQTVFENYSNTFYELNDYEVRHDLAAFMFTGEDVFKTLDKLSGGERVRLTLCKIFKTKPNVLILDEPTNHMDIISKETLEEMLNSYDGTLILVSHDRYFVKKLSNKLLVFEDGSASFYEYGYEQYLKEKEAQRLCEIQIIEDVSGKSRGKKTFTTPLKEKARKERAIKKAEEQIAALEEKINFLSEEIQECATDYVKLSELQSTLEQTEKELYEKMEEWENLQSDN